MAVNYCGAVRMVLALLPHWRERQFGHVVNVSSAGVQARNPKYTSYLPTKVVLDAFSEVVSTETLSDHITFTNMHMPLVRTPMIAPSRRLNPVPPTSAEHAAAMVVRGLVEKPTRIDTPLGRIADFENYFTPKLSRRVLHQLYLGYPDSPAARRNSSDATLDVTPARRPKRPSRAVPSLRVPRPVKRANRAAAGCALVRCASATFLRALSMSFPEHWQVIGWFAVQLSPPNCRISCSRIHSSQKVLMIYAVGYAVLAAPQFSRPVEPRSTTHT